MAVLELHQTEDGIDHLTVGNALGNDGLKDVGGNAGLVDLMEGVGTPSIVPRSWLAKPSSGISTMLLNGFKK